MNWDNFVWFSGLSMIWWTAACLLAFFRKEKTGTVALVYGAGILTFAVFIAGFWIDLGRPPMRTLGETRLWYSFFLSAVGLFTYLMWKYWWMLSFTTLMSAVFIVINLSRPEIYSQALMPALQSAWFVPHVTIYICSYALFGCATLLALTGLVSRKHREEVLPVIDYFLKAGLCFFTFGMLFGALWAKEAWGDYWTWDNKETWALITYLLYGLYFHLKHHPREAGRKTLLALVLISFLSLQMCWWGVNYLPNARESLHSYTQQP